MTRHIFPQKYKDTIVETICNSWTSDRRQAQVYLLGAVHAARVAGDLDLEQLFAFYYNRLHNFQFTTPIRLRNLRGDI